MLAHAGSVLPRLLADRVGLSGGLSRAVSRAGFTPVHDRGRVLVDAATALCAGASCVTDIEALSRQNALLGGRGVSDSTVVRALDEFATRIGASGLPTRRLATAIGSARAAAWQAIADRHDGLPAVMVAGRPLTRPVPDGGGQRCRPVTVLRLDATLIDAASAKDGAAGTYKGGWGFHPLTAWCSNVGDNLAVLLRPGNAGSFTAADHIRVLDHALAQVPAAHRQDVLVTVDGAGASHVLIEHLSALNTVRRYPTQGRRVEYSIGWPVDERTRRAIDLAPPDAWGPGLHASGSVDEAAGVIDLTGLMRSSMNGETLAGWPADMRVLARRVPRPAGEQAALGEDPDWRYSAFATNTATGQVQWLDARHRTQAHVEDNIKELKAHGARRLPSSDWARNTAWLLLAALATSLTAWLRLIALDDAQAKAEVKALRYRILAAPARLITHARRRVLKIPTTWAWAQAITTAWERLRALHPA